MGRKAQRWKRRAAIERARADSHGGKLERELNGKLKEAETKLQEATDRIGMLRIQLKEAESRIKTLPQLEGFNVMVKPHGWARGKMFGITATWDAERVTYAMLWRDRRGDGPKAMDYYQDIDLIAREIYYKIREELTRQVAEATGGLRVGG